MHIELHGFSPKNSERIREILTHELRDVDGLVFSFHGDRTRDELHVKKPYIRALSNEQKDFKKLYKILAEIIPSNNSLFERSELEISIECVLLAEYFEV